MPRLQERRNLIWLLFAVAAGSYYVSKTVLEVLPYLGPEQSDFHIYYDASRAVLMGKSPFAVDGFIYPPLLSFLLTPIALLDHEPARLLWFWVSHICLVVSGVLVWKALDADRIATLVTVVVWVIGGAVFDTLLLGQVNPLLLLLISTAWYFDRRRSWVGAAGLGIASAIKLWPSALLLAYVRSRDWKSLLVAVTVLISFTALPWMAVVSFLPPPHSPPVAKAWMGTPALFNFSLPAVALRLLDPPVAGQRLPPHWELGSRLQNVQLKPADAAASVGVGFATYLLGFSLVMWSSRGRSGRHVQRLWLAALTSLALVSSPISWSHYQLLQYPGAAYLLASFLRQGRAGSAAFVAALFLGLYQIPMLGLGVYLSDYGWTAANSLSLWFFSSLSSICALFLFGVCIWELRAKVDRPEAMPFEPSLQPRSAAARTS